MKIAGFSSFRRGLRVSVQARRAEPVDGHPGRGDRQLGQHDGQPRQVAVLFAGVVGGTDDDVLDLFRRDIGIAFQERVDAVRQHVIGTRQVEAPAVGLRKPRADAVYDYDFSCHS